MDVLFSLRVSDALQSLQLFLYLPQMLLINDMRGNDQLPTGMLLE